MSSPGTAPGRAVAVSAVCIGVGILAVLAAVNSYQTSARYAESFPDAFGAARAEVRFAALLAEVPATAELGYLTDLIPGQAAHSAAFLATQFALAPRSLSYVSADARPELALGNFSKPQDFRAAGAAWSYELVKDFGNGVILYRRKRS